MKYPIKYEEKSPNTFMFTFMCEVSLKRKEKSLVFSDSYTANSKAKGKTGCSLKMLHRIYSAFP